MASSWRENQLVQIKKRNLKESSWFGESKCMLRSRWFFSSFFLLLFIVFLNLCCSNFVKMKWKTCYGLKTLLRANQLPQFFNNFRVDMVDFVNSHKVNIKRNAFWTLTSAWNEGEKKIKSWKKREKKNQKFS